MNHSFVQRLYSPRRTLLATLLSAALVTLSLGCYSESVAHPSNQAIRQGSKTVYYAESWKKGDNRQIRELTVKLGLDQHNSTYETVITDASGDKTYRLVVEPSYLIWDDFGHLRISRTPPNGSSSTVSFWSIDLFESDEKVSLLIANRDQGHVIDEDNTLSLLYPIEHPNWIKVGIFGVPIASTRIIKVEGFYCVIRVKHYQLRPATERAFESIELEIEFTNNRPALADQKRPHN